jgi:UDP-N-acetyl-2-amino-2-deoxyglucuronate dehydrogenase
MNTQIPNQHNKHLSEIQQYPKIENRKIRIAVIGCGRISKKHFDSIEKYPDDFKLVAVCDNNKQTLQQATEQYKVNGYHSLSEMLEKEQLDAVSLCTPSGVHSEQAIKSAENGVHVISEKPMATRWKDAVDMVKSCEKNSVRLFVVKQNRRNPTLQMLKKTVDEKRFGRIYMVNINVFWTRPQEYYDTAKWRGTWKLDGGALMNQASHYVDLIDWLIGPVEKIQAMTGTLARDIEVEDTGVLNIKWSNGAMGSMNVTMLTYPKNFEGSITILGERGTVRVGGIAVNEIQHWKFEDDKEYDKDIQEANYQTNSIYGFGHSLYYKNVIGVLRGECEPETDGKEGLKSIEVLIAAYLSARNGQSVSLPLDY